MDQKIVSRLERMNACIDAVAWIKRYNTVKEAWINCERGDWMLWLIGERIENIKQRKLLVLCACQCARLSLKYVKKGEKRPRIAIETAENWAKNIKGITIEDVKNADAVSSASAASASAVSAAYTASASVAAVRSRTLKKCANIVRKFYPDYKF